MTLTTSEYIAAVSTLIALGAFGVAVYAIHRSNKNSSVITLITLTEGFRQAWQSFLSAGDEDTRQYKFCELMNFIEVSCLTYLENSFVGASSELMEEYLRDTLHLLDSSDEVVKRLGQMDRSPTTFLFIRRYIDNMAQGKRPDRVLQAITSA